MMMIMITITITKTIMIMIIIITLLQHFNKWLFICYTLFRIIKIH